MDRTREIEHFLFQFDSHKGFNTQAFMQLADDIESEAALQIVARFVFALGDSILLLERAIESRETVQVEKVCHKIIGMADLIGFKELGRKAREVRSLIKDSRGELFPEIEVRQLLQICEGDRAEFINCFPDYKDFI